MRLHIWLEIGRIPIFIILGMVIAKLFIHGEVVHGWLAVVLAVYLLIAVALSTWEEDKLRRKNGTWR